MRKLLKAGVVLLGLLIGFSSFGVMTSWEPVAFAQDGGEKGKAPSARLSVLAAAAVKDLEVQNILVKAGIVATQTDAVADAFMKQFAAVGLDTTVDKINQAIADQSQWQTIMQDALRGAIPDLGGDLSKVQDDIVQYVPDLTGFQITALEQITDNLRAGAVGFVDELSISGIPADADDAYWDKQVDPYVERVQKNLLGLDPSKPNAPQFGAIPILASTIGAFTGNTGQEVIDGKVDESTIAAISEASEQFKQFLNAALRRMRSLQLGSLAQQVDQLTTALAQVNQQLDTIQGELEELKQRRDPLPLILALAALVLAAGALGLTVRRRAA